MGGDEEFQNIQTFAEVRFNGQVDDLTGGVGHQTAGAGQLTDLLNVTTGPGVGHHVDGVEGIEGAHEFGGDVVGGFAPEADDLAVAFVFGDETAAEEFFDLVDILIGLFHDGLFGGGYFDILETDGDTGLGGGGVAHGFDAVQQLGSVSDAHDADAAIDDIAQHLFGDGAVIVSHFFGDGDVIVEFQTAHGGFEAAGHTVFPVFEFHPFLFHHLIIPFRGFHDFDEGVKIHIAVFVGHVGFVIGAEDFAFALGPFLHGGEVIGTENHILSGDGNGMAVFGVQNIIGRDHQQSRFGLSFGGERNVNRHLVAVEVGVVSRTYQRMEFQGATFDKDRFKGLNPQTVQCGGAV